MQPLTFVTKRNPHYRGAAPMKLYNVLDVMSVAHRCAWLALQDSELCARRRCSSSQLAMPVPICALTGMPGARSLIDHACRKYGCAEVMEEARQKARARYEKAAATQSGNQERRRCGSGHRRPGVVAVVLLLDAACLRETWTCRRLLHSAAPVGWLISNQPRLPTQPPNCTWPGGSWQQR